MAGDDKTVKVNVMRVPIARISRPSRGHAAGLYMPRLVMSVMRQSFAYRPALARLREDKQKIDGRNIHSVLFRRAAQWNEEKIGRDGQI